MQFEIGLTSLLLGTDPTAVCEQMTQIAKSINVLLEIIVVLFSSDLF